MTNGSLQLPSGQPVVVDMTLLSNRLLPPSIHPPCDYEGRWKESRVGLQLHAPPYSLCVSGLITALRLTSCLCSGAVTASTIAAMAGSEAMTEKIICRAPWVGLAGLQLHGSHRVTVLAQWIAVWTRAVWLAAKLGWG